MSASIPEKCDPPLTLGQVLWLSNPSNKTANRTLAVINELANVNRANEQVVSKLSNLKRDLQILTNPGQ